eukprot:491630-Pyramimonas_sp.AAC.1
MGLGGLKMASRRPQEGPKSARERPQRAPRGPRDALFEPPRGEPELKTTIGTTVAGTTVRTT